MIQLINIEGSEVQGAVQELGGHYDNLLARKDLGFHQTPAREFLWKESIQRGQQIRQNFKQMVVLGIGGSSLGGRAILSALAPDQTQNLLFFENVDGFEFWRRLDQLKDLRVVHFVLVSKSGTTLETLTQASFVQEKLLEHGLDLKLQATVITEKRKNPLYDWAVDERIPVLEIPIDVGGRFSVLTPVGLLPTAFLGLDVLEMKKGAEWALAQKPLWCELAQLSLQSFRREEWITLFWTYSDRLRDFGLWIQQLWAESLGKAANRKGGKAPRASTPMPLVGANDQHSVQQQVMEGAPDKFTVFIRDLEAESFGRKLEQNLFPHLKYTEGKVIGALLAAEAQATARALKESGRHSATLQVDTLDERTLGAMFMGFELLTGLLGECLDINAFDQPGVELGKKLAKEILSR
ncbi:MAG: glucose-6-phosphate isomerase [Bdellovibrionales bacterium]|nr:glucose-6-phosphate isomerase [Bdellovibrionales bacterium]